MRSQSQSARGNKGNAARIGVRLAINDPDLAARARAELSGSSVFVEARADAILSLTDDVVRSSSVVDVSSGTIGQRPKLSPREAEVVGLLLEGASNKAIARRLNISVHTAKFHVSQILEKVAAQNRADAVSIILRDGLVSL